MVLLQRTLDSSLLREKELAEQERTLLHRQQEMADSRLFRETGQLPPPRPMALPPSRPPHLP